jgi:hypothetical protein
MSRTSERTRISGIKSKMALGVRFQLNPINKGDTAELKAALREREGIVTQEEIAGVEFTIQTPTQIANNEPPLEAKPGEVEDNGEGYLQFTETDEVGEYIVQAQFTLITQEIKSAMINFTVEDPFNIPPVTEAQLVAEEVWLRFEDSFDSVEGGPILRDYTLAHFDQKKIERFIPEALLDINVQMPPTQYTISTFATRSGNGEINPLMPLLSKGVMCKVLLHMIRSYIEQPVPQGAQIAYEDRTRYAQAWQTAYATEREDWISMVRLYKRQELRLGHSALLVSSKAGRLLTSGALRTQNISRGWY